jgi:glyoxalase family protein
MSRVTGLHHVTVIAGDPQRNLDFYTGVLGMKLVKVSVNQDVPDTYHLFYADAVGHPGTDLTFFPWPQMPPGRRGTGLTNEVALAVPAESLGFWADRLRAAGVSVGAPVVRFGERALVFDDPHGLGLALVGTDDAREFAPWAEGPVPPELQVRGLHGVRMAQRDLEASTRFLVDGLGMTHVGEEDGWHRFATGETGSGRVVDVQLRPDLPRGTWGVGSVHHVAWRVPDDAEELAVRERARRAGAHPTPVIDRFWFQSVYFKEPGGALFELATDGPGFAVDESPDALGARLILPPWLEPQRAEIERALPPLRRTDVIGAGSAAPATAGGR